MKVYISVDMEGISGLTDRDDMARDGTEFARGRQLLMSDLNAAIEGAFEGGASEVLVNDGHMTMRNVMVEALDTRAELILGPIKRGCMMEGLDESFGAVFLVGYSSKHGTIFGLLNHSMTGRALQNLYLNGETVGEMAINAAYAGQMRVPVTLVTGDQTAAQEARDVFGEEVETVVVKEGLERYAAKLLPPTVTRELIREGATRAVEEAREVKPFVVASPSVVGVEFTSTAMAEVCSWLPSVARTGPRNIEFPVHDWREGMGLLYALLWLAKNVLDPVY